MLLRHLSTFLLCGLFCLPASFARADIEIQADELRRYEVPRNFGAAAARYTGDGAGNTFIWSTTMEGQGSCVVIVASDDEARSLRFQNDMEPTTCVGLRPGTDGSFFLRTNRAGAEPGEVTGVTAGFDAQGELLFKIRDQELVDATEAGAGAFIGSYFQPHPSMAYSPQLSRLLAYSVGSVVISGQENFITQAHIINTQTGRLTRSGQTFGQSGVGLVGESLARQDNGNFLLYFYQLGTQGAVFYNYNGRENISLFRPAGIAWDGRFVIRMRQSDGQVRLLWTPTDRVDADTRITVTTQDGAEFWGISYEPLYITAQAEGVNLGRPLDMWNTSQLIAVLHMEVVSQEFWLRVVDRDGNHWGAARLDDVTDFDPIAIVEGADDSLVLVTYEPRTSAIYEYVLTITDIEDFDPDNPPIPDDVGIPDDIGFSDILEAAGCCATARKTPGDFAGDLLLVLLSLGLLSLRRRR